MLNTGGWRHMDTIWSLTAYVPMPHQRTKTKVCFGLYEFVAAMYAAAAALVAASRSARTQRGWP